MTNFDFSSYISPFTWRYSSREMRTIFSEQNKYRLWRKIWVALAEGQYKARLVSKQEFDDLKKNEGNIDIERILELEKETRHDVVAAIKEFSEQAKIGGGKIHLGATSMDIVDNADMLRMKEALQLVEIKIKKLLSLFGTLITKYASFPCIGYTHLQPAEPTTVGYRMAFYAQDLMGVLNQLKFVLGEIKGKGMKGAVGTAASYVALLKNNKTTAAFLEKRVMESVGLEPVLISTQVYPRQFDYLVLSVLAFLASTLSKFAGDLRILQSPTIGEWSEPFGKKQVGSSAMPFKKNPISSENICSLGRFVAKLPEVALENSTLSYLERTLDDSANKRLIIPEGFLAVDQILITAEKILTGLVVNEKKITLNLHLYAPFAATEGILMEAVKNGASRQEMHEILRNISMTAWAAIQDGKPNPMSHLLCTDKIIANYISKKKIQELLDVSRHIGDAPDRSLQLVKKIKSIL
ncbi:adenylosuccinate lyase [Candidatus Roizmanbacteria bacterium CG_4_10_14_3_um_filter_39_13]|uniref:Adenylosuccinate lyase n=2 Tax=Candidatus Roizmaniibacteriota TaxID=1752723 RepID=A0A2H0KKK0_9BACT|nr:MAG: adenylosuccinate lyase [Candidatus Roizmanbacteria bacterium CG11_big_fil_rev_8_21_14_0_20_37_16]PIX68584.1 MAG: adenylosuccinate lyase [Candidatus Roizmanbacteria bacterium CG_4_10_14_3_um_filter_39_13]